MITMAKATGWILAAEVVLVVLFWGGLFVVAVRSLRRAYQSRRRTRRLVALLHAVARGELTKEAATRALMEELRS